MELKHPSLSSDFKDKQVLIFSYLYNEKSE